MRSPILLMTLLALLVSAPAQAQEAVTVCHATGNPQNPYVTIALNNAGVLEHINHEDDLVPAPAGGCPDTVVVLPEDTPVPTATPGYSVPTPAPTATPRPPRDDDDQDGDVQGGDGSGSGGGSPTLTGSRSATRAADTRDLPMTGAEMWLIAAAGIGFLLSGTGIRLLTLASGRSPGPSGR